MEGPCEGSVLVVWLLPVDVMNNEPSIAPQEELILRLLEARDVIDNPILGCHRIKGSMDKMASVDVGYMLDFDEMKPKRIFTFDATDNDRLFMPSHHGLMAHPSDILGENAETGVIHLNTMKWLGYRRLKARPRGVCSAIIGNHDYYEVHLRVVGQSHGYYKRVVAFDKSGAPVTLFKNGKPVGSSVDYQSVFLTCSIVEDSSRVGAYLCSISDYVELLFPISTDDVFDFFALREAPLTNSGRRRALIHWVSGHLRNTHGAKKTNVREHYRGITEFTMDGLTVKVTPNNYPS